MALAEDSAAASGVSRAPGGVARAIMFPAPVIGQLGGISDAKAKGPEPTGADILRGLGEEFGF